jgi:hypothetical protein
MSKFLNDIRQITPPQPVGNPEIQVNAGAQTLEHWGAVWDTHLAQGLIEDRTVVPNPIVQTNLDVKARLTYLARKAKKGLITPTCDSDKRLIAHLKTLET